MVDEQFEIYSQTYPYKTLKNIETGYFKHIAELLLKGADILNANKLILDEQFADVNKELSELEKYCKADDDMFLDIFAPHTEQCPDRKSVV
jgi:hypothetical protein